MYYILFDKKTKEIRYFEEKDVYDSLYYLNASVPTIDQIKKYSKYGNDKRILDLFSLDIPTNEIILKIKKSISKIELKLPLYDEYSNNLHIIDNINVYKRVVYNNYRFPDAELLEVLNKRKNRYEEKGFSYDYRQDIVNVTNNDLPRIDIEKKRYKKLVLMLDFIDSFDIETLTNTYVHVFYYYANEVGKNLTICLRPSFLPRFTHIKPYYTRSELINLALNMELIEESTKYYDSKEVMKLCSLVKKNDIDAQTILSHQVHIANNNCIGLIQYYTITGASYINYYLRNKDAYENKLLETNIKELWNLVNTAPAFDKQYTLYRFVSDDNYLKHLNIGDKFSDDGFTSTTRNPFFYEDIDKYRFGFVLIKINLPENIKGVALCVETYSHYPQEQEILLSPLSILRLDNKNENTLYYSTNNNIQLRVKTKYEFTYIGKKDIMMPKHVAITSEHHIIDFLTIQKADIYDKIRYFIKNYVDLNGTFRTLIGNHTYEIFYEWYNSTKVYKKYYAIHTDKGFAFYTIENKYISFVIELGEIDEEPYMYVNYYFRHSSIGKRRYNDVEFIDFISKIAFYFDIVKIVLYCDYISCDTNTTKDANPEDTYLGGNYNIEFYEYLKHGIRKYKNKIDPTELLPIFSYYELDRLKKTSPSQILNRLDQDEIYQIYSSSYNKQDTLADFYIWLIENYCVHVNTFINKMYRFYNSNNPFEKDYYILDSGAYLYNKGLIPSIPEKINNPYGKVDDKMKIRNRYRVDDEINQRVPNLSDIKKLFTNV